MKQYSPVACNPVRDLILNAPSDKLNRVIKRFLPGGVIENPARVCENAISRCAKCENVLVDTWVRVEVGISVWLFAIRTERQDGWASGGGMVVGKTHKPQTQA